jgi:hypothetical protein
MSKAVKSDTSKIHVAYTVKLLGAQTTQNQITGLVMSNELERTWGKKKWL